MLVSDRGAMQATIGRVSHIAKQTLG